MAEEDGSDRDRHILASFEAALSSISAGFFEVGEKVTWMTESAARSCLEDDRKTASKVVEADLDVDAMYERLRQETLGVLLRFQPSANDLRFVVGIEHSIVNIERAGDHAKGIAEAVMASTRPALAQDHVVRLRELSEGVLATLREALGAVHERDAARARRCIAMDAGNDAVRDAVLETVVRRLRQGSGAPEDEIRAMLVAKALERIGDQATNIAEEALFMARGISPTATRVGGDPH